MTEEQIKELVDERIEEILKDRLRIDVRKGPEYGASGDVVSIKIVLQYPGYGKDKTISEGSFTLPDNDKSRGW